MSATFMDVVHRSAARYMHVTCFPVNTRKMLVDVSTVSASETIFEGGNNVSFTSTIPLSNVDDCNNITAIVPK